MDAGPGLCARSASLALLAAATSGSVPYLF